MPGPKPAKKPKAKPVKYSDGTYSWIDGEDTLQVGTEIFVWLEVENEYKPEEAVTGLILEDGTTLDIDSEGKISYIS